MKKLTVFCRSNYTALARAAVEGDETALDMFGTWNKSGMGNSLLSQVTQFTVFNRKVLT